VAYELRFNALHEYGSDSNGITVPIVLSDGERKVEVKARVDTGASFCVFERGYAEALGLAVESGDPVMISTVTGSFKAFGHTVTLSTFNYSFDVMVYFAEHESFQRNVLGRRGWLDQLRVGIVEYESKLYLNRYDES
jgi:hypothetical protein